ncbi:IclR family transcriptional regulator C-terminal domain-containing protein [Phenylobacterium sp. Root700]|uniref:IclR family transcriptional regulator domain-containing protein n=1 Tax=Phenylobacterium sp. Root700 TaxID=1736591 RepID=UPI0006F75FEE|nr:IclR family transcriptional regulator C-terminal domain-containing protein [Phenylobacterium sp. Root700]KRB40948.1 hypothetical protein ASE02_06130 [Phenylobacterium sp. Root700]
MERRDQVQSFVRGLRVIRSFSADRPVMALSEVAEEVGLTRAAARRLLLTLVDEGFARMEGKRFRLTPRILDLGYAYLSSVEALDEAQTVLAELATEIGESCSMSVLEGDEVVYVARVTASRLMTLSLRVGSRLPAFHTSTGRVMLAYSSPDRVEKLMSGREFAAYTPKTVTSASEIWGILRRARQQGWCLCDEELEVGLISLAVPVYDRGGCVTAALNVSSHTSRTPASDLLQRALPRLQSAAEQLVSRSRA